MNLLLNLDIKLFLFINSDLANPILDFIFPIITQQKVWIVLLAIMAVIYFRKSGKKSLYVILFGILLIGISDLLCVRIIKPLFHRHRPCDPDFLVEGGRFLVGNLRSLSFPSAHAMNFFAASAFFSLLYHKYWLIFLCTAFIIGLTRIYVGVHYPLDVLGGGLAGLALGYIYGKIALKFFSPWIVSNHE